MGHITLQESLRRAQELDSLRGTIERLESELQQSVDRERSVWREKAQQIDRLESELAGARLLNREQETAINLRQHRIVVVTDKNESLRADLAHAQEWIGKEQRAKEGWMQACDGWKVKYERDLAAVTKERDAERKSSHDYTILLMTEHEQREAALTEQRDKALDALAALEPYLTTEAQMLDSASLNEGRASSYDTASIKARKVLAEARGCEE